MIAAALGAGPAAAHKSKASSQVTIEFQRNLVGPDHFSGVVTSAKRQCASRVVVELRYRPGYEGGGGGEQSVPVARTKTDASGNWAVDHEVTDHPGSEYSGMSAWVLNRRLKPKNAKHKHVCKTGYSETKTILNPGFLLASA